MINKIELRKSIHANPNASDIDIMDTTCQKSNTRTLANKLGQRKSDVRHIVETALYELAPGFIEMSHETMSMNRLNNLICDLTDYMFYIPQADLRAKIHEKLKD